MTRSYCDRCGTAVEKPDVITITRLVPGDLPRQQYAEFPPVRREFCLACAGLIWRHLSDTLIEQAGVPHE